MCFFFCCGRIICDKSHFILCYKFHDVALSCVTNFMFASSCVINFMFSLYHVLQISWFCVILCYKFHVFALSCVTNFMVLRYPVFQISCFLFILCCKFHVFALSCVTNFMFSLYSVLQIFMFLFPRNSQFSSSYTLGKLFASRNRSCPPTNIRAYFCAKWRLLFIIIWAF